jgi:hypothetical protein
MAMKIPFVRITVARAVFLMITVDAPRRARGRNRPIFLVPEETRSGVYFAKRAFPKPAFWRTF